ncbi:MAG: helicase C-terminal domain-containing protein [Pseudomonadota bacterium]
MKEKLQISVRGLVECTLRSGDLTWEVAGRNRAVEGTRVHRELRKNRPPEYSGEVPVSIQVETDRFILEVGGRMDGLFAYPDRVIVEEVKSTVLDPEDLGEDPSPLHWGQVKVYAYIAAVQKGLSRLTARLTYAHVSSGRTRSFDRDFSLPELESFWNGIIDRYLGWVGRASDFRARRNASLAELGFPYPGFRPGQRDMAVGVYQAVKNHGRLLVQAPTGIGKTMAALFPALKALGLGSADKVFYLTARGTGAEAAGRALENLRRQGAVVKSLILSAKEKTCLNPGTECGPETCQYARGHFDRVDQALENLFPLHAFDRETIRDSARRERVCPFELSLDLALGADVIICDYNYVFDPRVHLRRFFLETREKYVFLIDEAHNLVDRAREMFSAELRSSDFSTVKSLLGPDFFELTAVLEKIEARFALAGRGAKAFFHEKQPPEGLAPLLDEFVKSVEKRLSRSGLGQDGAPLADLYRRTGFFLKIAEGFDENYAACHYPEEQGLRLRLFCLDPSANLRAVLKRGTAAVFFSASLAPLAFFQGMFGLDETARSLVLPSPFPPERFRVLVLDRVSTLYRDRERTKRPVAEAIRAVARWKSGNYLVFFPSYEYLALVGEELERDFPEGEILRQTPGMSEDDRAAFLARFSAEAPGRVVGLAVMGGVFGEGVDLTGERLSGTVVVGPGLPGISPENELIREHFSARGRDGFEFAYLFPGLGRVLQAAGRVIRSENDRGVALLIDHRFSRPECKSLFPRHWRPTGVGNLSGLESSLRDFWEGFLA